MIGIIVRDAEEAFYGEVCFRDEKDINVVSEKEHLEFVSVLAEAIGIPNGYL
jgi:hypothetical protein